MTVSSISSPTPGKPWQPQALRQLIQKTLVPFGLYSANAEELLMATCAQESLLGKFRRQEGGGPALGIFQMEPADFNDIWTNYLAYRVRMADELRALASTQPPRPAELVTNDPFAIVLCRVQYERVPEPLPSAGDLNALWRYYKQHYNTPEGVATQEQFYAHYQLTAGLAR